MKKKSTTTKNSMKKEIKKGDIKKHNKNNNIEEFLSVKNKNNYIIAEIIIEQKEVNKKVQIINSFDNYYYNNPLSICIPKDEIALYKNHKQISENCLIKINEDIIGFDYFHKFKKKGKYIIEYVFKNNLTKTDFMFSLCTTLININLAHFNTENITNMSWMFHECKKLENIDLSNYKTENVNKMQSIYLELGNK